jgi:hypothetical protein
MADDVGGMLNVNPTKEEEEKTDAAAAPQSASAEAAQVVAHVRAEELLGAEEKDDGELQKRQQQQQQQQHCPDLRLVVYYFSITDIQQHYVVEDEQQDRSRPGVEWVLPTTIQTVSYFAPRPIRAPEQEAACCVVVLPDRLRHRRGVKELLASAAAALRRPATVDGLLVVGVGAEKRYINLLQRSIDANCRDERVDARSDFRVAAAPLGVRVDALVPNDNVHTVPF